jgi:putative ABC transport system ATP-binding protein
MATLFELEDVRVDLGGRPVLDVPCLAIASVGITVLAGPSGSGKSTLLRLCNRLEVPTSGRVRFRGDDVAGLDPLSHRRRVGMVFQRPATFPGTVRDNLRVACGAVDANEPFFVDALAQAGLDASFLDRRADDLSGGEAQRACLARTLVTRPEVLLLDEPTSSLDPAATAELEARTIALAREGVPVVWVSHDLAQVGRIADDVVVLLDGSVADDNGRRRFLDEVT